MCAPDNSWVVQLFDDAGNVLGGAAAEGAADVPQPLPGDYENGDQYPPLSPATAQLLSLLVADDLHSPSGTEQFPVSFDPLDVSDQYHPSNCASPYFDQADAYAIFDRPADGNLLNGTMCFEETGPIGQVPRQEIIIPEWPVDVFNGNTMAPAAHEHSSPQIHSPLEYGLTLYMSAQPPANVLPKTLEDIFGALPIVPPGVSKTVHIPKQSSRRKAPKNNMLPQEVYTPAEPMGMPRNDPVVSVVDNNAGTQPSHLSLHQTRLSDEGNTEKVRHAGGVTANAAWSNDHLHPVGKSNRLGYDCMPSLYTVEPLKKGKDGRPLPEEVWVRLKEKQTQKGLEVGTSDFDSTFGRADEGHGCSRKGGYICRFQAVIVWEHEDAPYWMDLGAPCHREVRDKQSYHRHLEDQHFGLSRTVGRTLSERIDRQLTRLGITPEVVRQRMKRKRDEAEREIQRLSSGESSLRKSKRGRF